VISPYPSYKAQPPLTHSSPLRTLTARPPPTHLFTLYFFYWQFERLCTTSPILSQVDPIPLTFFRSLFPITSFSSLIFFSPTKGSYGLKSPFLFSRLFRLLGYCMIPSASFCIMGFFHHPKGTPSSSSKLFEQGSSMPFHCACCGPPSVPPLT